MNEKEKNIVRQRMIEQSNIIRNQMRLPKKERNIRLIERAKQRNLTLRKWLKDK